MRRSRRVGCVRMLFTKLTDLQTQHTAHRYTATDSDTDTDTATISAVVISAVHAAYE